MLGDGAPTSIIPYCQLRVFDKGRGQLVQASSRGCIQAGHCLLHQPRHPLPGWRCLVPRLRPGWGRRLPGLSTKLTRQSLPRAPSVAQSYQLPRCRPQLHEQRLGGLRLQLWRWFCCCCCCSPSSGRRSLLLLPPMAKVLCNVPLPSIDSNRSSPGGLALMPPNHIESLWVSVP